MLLQSNTNDHTFISQQLDKVLTSKIIQGSALPVIKIHSSKTESDDTDLSLPTEVLDVQTSNQNSS